MRANTRTAKNTARRIAYRVSFKPYERRTVCIVSASAAQQYDRKVGSSCVGARHTHFARNVVTAAVGRGEMRWVDRHHNVATYTEAAAATWQKTPSGPVHTMQMVVGMKGRNVPAGQRELVSA